MIYDISQELFSCSVYPGDPAPVRKPLQSMEAGDLYNLTALSLCAHNGTHVDAPAHFIKEGKTVDELDLAALFGACLVVRAEGDLTAAHATALLAQAADARCERLLIAGNATVTEEAAAVLADGRASFSLRLVGVESQSVGPLDAPMATHKLLLGAGILLLEGLRLARVPEGVYLLSALPLNLGGCEGAPCRAALITYDDRVLTR